MIIHRQTFTGKGGVGGRTRTKRKFPLQGQCPCQPMRFSRHCGDNNWLAWLRERQVGLWLVHQTFTEGRKRRNSVWFNRFFMAGFPLLGQCSCHYTYLFDIVRIVITCLASRERQQAAYRQIGIWLTHQTFTGEGEGRRKSVRFNRFKVDFSLARTVFVPLRLSRPHRADSNYLPSFERGS